MGNMGNPIITRLGRKQLWYRKWYTDKNYKSVMKITNTFENVLNLYLVYGLLFKNSIFYNDYWYKNQYLKTNFFSQKVKQLNTYFRRYFYFHKKLTIEHNYLIRQSTPEFFPMRLYTLKYLNWFIISIQWFKPSKLKPLHLLQNPNYTKNTLISKNSTFSNKNQRLKLVFMYLRNYIKKQEHLYYIF